MYYPTLNKKIVQKKNRNRNTLLIVFLSLITFHSNSFAAVKNPTAEEIRIEGFAEQQKGNFNTALSLYSKSLSIKPNQPQVLNDIGVVYEQLDQLGRAEDKYLEAIRADKRYLPAYLNLAYLYQKKGDLVKSIEYFRKRIELGKPNEFWTQKAKEDLAKLTLGLPTGREQLKQVKNKALKLQADKLAQELAAKTQREWEQKTKLAQEYSQRGQKLVAEKKYKKAIEAFDKALELSPENKEIVRVRENAVEELNREKIRSHIAHAIELLDLGENASAKEEFRKILTIIPNESVQKSE